MARKPTRRRDSAERPTPPPFALPEARPPAVDVTLPAAPERTLASFDGPTLDGFGGAVNTLTDFGSHDDSVVVESDGPPSIVELDVDHVEALDDDDVEEIEGPERVIAKAVAVGLLVGAALGLLISAVLSRMVFAGWMW